ncbi:MAG: hypothetical protein AAF253_07260 [Pseudomonadota bacterium]
MSPTLSTSASMSEDAAARTDALERLARGPWSVNEASPANRPLPRLGTISPSTVQEWYAEPRVVAVGTIALCAAFWAGLYLSATALY